MAYKIAPAAKAALAEATDRWPNRSRKSDGTVGDARHRNRRSWHNPSKPDGTPHPDGTVYAFDLTHDPANGVDAHALVRAAVARGDRRVLEAISNSKIWTKKRAAEGWREYSGSNPHDKHAHVSVDPKFADDTSPWWSTAAQPEPDPQPEPSEPGFAPPPLKYVKADVEAGHPEHGKVYAVTVHGRTWMKSGWDHMDWLAGRGLGPKRNGNGEFPIEVWPAQNVVNLPMLGAS